VAEDASPDWTALLTAAELARHIGISATTIKNWTQREPRPLATVTASDGSVRFTWSHLNDFCNEHPGLRGVDKIRQRVVGKPPGPNPATEDPAKVESEDLKSIARDLRNAASSSIQIALEAARLAEETARSHRQQLEGLAQVIAAFDAALSQSTAPSTLHD
jgi:hypothetical protein